MAKRKIKKAPSNFKVKAAATYKIGKSTDTASLLSLILPIPDVRISNGRVRPVFYDDGDRMTHVPR